MHDYLASLGSRLHEAEPFQLLWEVAEAFAEADPAQLGPAARRLHDLVRFSRFDAIAPWLANERDVVRHARDFALEHGESALAGLLDDALAGIAQPRARVRVTLPGRPQADLAAAAAPDTGLDGTDWGGTDIALGFAMDGYRLALLHALIAAAPQIPLQAPLALRRRRAASARVAATAQSTDAASLLRDLLAAPAPCLELGTWHAFEQGERESGLRLPVRHIAYPSAQPAHLAQLGERYGAAARDLLAMVELHDGAELFVHDGGPCFVLLGSHEWDAQRERALEWAREVTWQDEPEAIPAYLHSAIPFGMTPGDSECWLLVTEGAHAGKVMLSDTDLIDDTPRFASIAHFMATLLCDAAKILNNGGHVSFDDDGRKLVPLAFHRG